MNRAKARKLMLVLPAFFLLGGQGTTSSPIQADTARQFRQKCVLGLRGARFALA
jgi:hypothetical protein